MDTMMWLSAGGQGDATVLQTLRGAGWDVRMRRLDSGRDGLAQERPDVVLVDVPEGRAVRATLEVFVGAPGMANARFMALIEPHQAPNAASVGGLHDFVIRPLNVDELLARARRLVMTDGRDDLDCLVSGDLRIDLRGWEVTLGGVLLDFTYQEFQLLSFLAARPGRVFTRDQLLAQVWGLDYYGGSRTVDIHVRRIRAKLGSAHSRAIATVRNVGYKWRTAPLTR